MKLTKKINFHIEVPSERKSVRSIVTDIERSADGGLGYLFSIHSLLSLGLTAFAWLINAKRPGQQSQHEQHTMRNTGGSQQHTVIELTQNGLEKTHWRCL